MACVNFTGFESGNNGEARSTGGTVSFSTSTVRTGTYSLRVNPTTSASGSYRLGLNNTDGRPTAEMNKASLYTSLYFRITTAPGSNEEKIIEFADTGGSTKSYVTLTSTRVLKFYNNAGSLVATGATVLSTGAWHLLQFRTSTGSGSQAYEIKINGVSELSGSANQLTNNHGSIYIGKRDNLNSQSIDLFYDDVYVDDAAFYDGVEVKRIGPIANGATAAQWTAGTGGSDYTQVDEVVPDAADYIKSGTTVNHAHYFDLTSCATAGVTGTIKAVKALALVREDTSVTSADQVRFKSGATTTNTSSFNHSTTAVYVAKIEEVDPNTSAAWTTTNLDAAEIGVFEVNAVSMRCEYMSGFVAYIPSALYDAAVDPETFVFALPAVTATYAAILSAAVDPETFVFALPSVTASASNNVSAVVDPETFVFSVPSVTATYQQLNSAVADPETFVFSVPSVTATYVAALSAVVDPETFVFTTPSATASYQQLNNAAVDPETFVFALPSVTASYVQAGTAVVDPETFVFTVPSVTASYQQLNSAVVDPETFVFNLPVVAASYAAVFSAAVDPETFVFTLPSVTGNSSLLFDADPLPETFIFTLPSVTGSYVQAESATVTPETFNFNLPSVSAVYQELVNAVVAPEIFVFTLPSVTATSGLVINAVVVPVDFTYQIPAVSAIYAAEFLGIVVPLEIDFDLAAVVALGLGAAPNTVLTDRGLKLENGCFILQENGRPFIIQKAP